LKFIGYNSLLNDLFKEFPDIKGAANSTIQRQDIQKIQVAIASYNKMVKSFDPTAPGAKTTYAKLQSALKNIHDMESKLLNDVKGKVAAFGQQIEQNPQANDQVQSKGSTVEQMVDDITQQLQMLLLQMLPKLPKDPPLPILTTLMDSAKKTHAPSATEEAEEAAEAQAAENAENDAHEGGGAPPSNSADQTEDKAPSAAELSLGAKATLMQNQFLASFLDPDSRQQFEKGGKSDGSDKDSALEDMLKRMENQGATGAPLPPGANPIDYKSWSVDPSAGTSYDDAKKALVLDTTGGKGLNGKSNYSPPAGSLVAGKTYLFQFQCAASDATNINPSVILDGPTVELTKTVTSTTTPPTYSYGFTVPDGVVA
jgi:hypothetical protein